MNHDTLLFEGRAFGPGDLDMLRASTRRFVREELADFLEEWHAESPTVAVQSSGSTGTPKVMRVEKTRMRASARMTCSFLGLRAKDRALLCMPLRYIGAKMMVVRAIERGLDLHCVEPSGHPLKGLERAPDFLAVTPAQMFSSLEDPCEAELLRETRHIIIGGGAVDAALGRRLRDFPHAVWSTYGMTETLSHIALRRLNGPEASEWYAPFEGVSLRLTADGALCISAPAVCSTELVTNDLAVLDASGRFRILGRKDNVINSGGMKIQIEEMEELLRPVMPLPFQITAVPDEKFGEAVVMLTEGQEEEDWTPFFARLPRHARPKQTFHVPALPRTGTDKPDRAEARRLARAMKEQRHD